MSMDQGLILQQPDAREEVLTDKDIYLHAVGVLPQLRLAMQQSTEPRQGSGWIRHPKKDGIVIKEYQPMQTLTDQPAGSSWPDTSMSYAVLAECDIKCHVNEVMDVIFSDEAAHHDAAMTAVWGASYQRGDLLFSKSLDKGDRIWNVVGDNDLTSEQEGFFEYVQPGWISVKSASLRPRHTARLTTTLNRPQKLCFATYSRRSLMDDEAVYVMKTLPLPAHDQLIMRSQCSALQNGVDHIGVGYHFKSYYGHISGYSTRVVVFAYVNCASDDDRSSELRFKHGNIDTRAIANMDARKTVMLLARAARKFERIIRRRRLGHQRFVYFPIDRDNILESDCSICQKHFGLFRKDFYCQLCGHLTCRECSGKYDVEAIPGVIQKNRICFGCIARVENCLFEHAPKFDPSGLSASRITAAGLDEGPPRNKDDDLASSQHSFFSKKSEQLLAEDLFGADRETRAQAFKAIKQAVREAQDPRSPKKQCRANRSAVHKWHNKIVQRHEPKHFAFRRRMDEEQKQQLRDDLQFAIMKMEQLTVLDPKAPPSSKKNPMELKNLVDVFAVFGYSAEDIIDKHDQCRIFKKIRGELDDLLRELSSHGKKYDKAIMLRDRLRLMKKEFVEMQGRYELRRQHQETAQCEEDIENKRRDLQKTHAVELEQLEDFLRRLPVPRIKFSKLLLELKDTEKNLARLRLFEDAKNVFVRADAMERDERARHKANFEKFKDTKRALLLEKQREELTEMDEKLMEKRYITMRANENHRKTETQRMRNLREDMHHAHVMGHHSKRNFTMSAESLVRKGHGTSSTFRGQQLLGTVQGKRLEVVSLCMIHDQENGEIPPGSVVY
ncbi:TPA: hypothetical protein N0F65_009361 [Lagenidium giganteum]|uniref:FYVE-type domain-containing protein n=1 Tax=Lagenidium giganteum TaxID=4803 RepID=A0AAV2ZDD4_9STRA|nr:TPA: hypothetical protein N0F65_009361 [Lagenidium giganteum]